MTDDPTRQLPPDQPRRCPNCGSSVPPGAEFCPTCGNEMRPRKSRVWPIVIGCIVALAAGVGIALAVTNGNDNGGKASTVTKPVTSTVNTSSTTSVTVQTPTRTVTAPTPTRTVTVPTAPTTTPTAP